MYNMWTWGQPTSFEWSMDPLKQILHHGHGRGAVVWRKLGCVVPEVGGKERKFISRRKHLVQEVEVQCWLVLANTLHSETHIVKHPNLLTPELLTGWLWWPATTAHVARVLDLASRAA